MITTPVEKQRAKSYYLGPHHGGRHHDDNKSLGNNSVRVDQRRRSNPKPRKDKNKSLEKEYSGNSSKYFKNNKTIKRVFPSSFRTNPPTNRWINPHPNTSNLPTRETPTMTNITPSQDLIVKSKELALPRNPIKAATWLEWNLELTGPSNPNTEEMVARSRTD